jgi:hypothetical protein
MVSRESLHSVYRSGVVSLLVSLCVFSLCVRVSSAPRTRGGSRGGSSEHTPRPKGPRVGHGSTSDEANFIRGECKRETRGAATLFLDPRGRACHSGVWYARLFIFPCAECSPEFKGLILVGGFIVKEQRYWCKYGRGAAPAQAHVLTSRGTRSRVRPDWRLPRQQEIHLQAAWLVGGGG